MGAGQRKEVGGWIKKTISHASMNTPPTLDLSPLKGSQQLHRDCSRDATVDDSYTTVWRVIARESRHCFLYAINIRYHHIIPRMPPTRDLLCIRERMVGHPRQRRQDRAGAAPERGVARR